MGHRRVLVSVAAVTLLTACGAAGSDPSFWQPGQDIGGTQHDFSTGLPTATGGGGPVDPGAGGTPGTPPPPGGGGAGGFGPAGSGGFIGVSGGLGSGGTNPGAGGQGPAGTGGTPPVGPPQACSFTFNATTVSANGRFAPNNVGALWIEDSGGKFVKSLEVWGAERLPNLTAWVNDGANATDAVTSATHGKHGPHSGHWDCTNSSRTLVGTGGYRACVSFAEDDAFPFFGPPEHVVCTPFTTGAGPFTTSPPDQTNFKSMQLIMQ